MSTNCFPNGSCEPNGREEESSLEREDSSSLDEARGGLFGESHLEGEGKIEVEDGKQAELEVYDDDSVTTLNTFVADENTKVEPLWANILFNPEDEDIPQACNAPDNYIMENKDFGCDNIMEQQQASLSTLDVDDPEFDGGGKLGGEYFGNYGVERSDNSSSGIETVRGTKREAKSDTSSSETKKRKVGGKVKDEKSSEVAKKRERDKFIRWFSKQPTGIPIEWPKDSPAEKIEGTGGENFIKYGRRVIKKAQRLGMKGNIAARLEYVLDNSLNKSYAEMFDMTTMCFLPVKDGTRKEIYSKRHCKVCKAAGELIDQSDHNCPYCHDCFKVSGWKKECVFLQECDEHNECRDESDEA